MAAPLTTMRTPSTHQALTIVSHVRSADEMWPVGDPRGVWMGLMLQ